MTSPKQPKVEIEYCGSWGYGNRYVEIADAIRKQVPHADITGTVGRRTCFEVTVNGSLIHSKLATMGFPNTEQVVKIVEDVAAGSEPAKVTEVEKANCTIL